MAGEEARKPVLPAILAFNVARATLNVNQGFQIVKNLIFRLIDKTVKSIPQNRILLLHMTPRFFGGDQPR